MSRALPTHPHADHLRRQARELLRGWRASDPNALQRAVAWRLQPPWRLATAQLVIAREHAQPSWPRLLADVERRRAAALDDKAFVERVVALAIGEGWHAPQPRRALALMKARPACHDEPVLALLRGELDGVHDAVMAALHRRHPPLDAPPLVYAATSGLAQLDTHRVAIVASVEALLAAGADPNATWADPENPQSRLPVLYGAVARARCLPVVERLLAAGANPNDGESLYHAAEHPGGTFFAPLIAAGARWTGTHALLRQLDHDDLAGLAQALALGADPNERGPEGRCALHHALLRGRDLETLRLLLRHGADAQATDDAGITPPGYALRAGRRDAMALLRAHGAEPPVLDAMEAFVAACAAADADAAKALQQRHPGWPAALPPQHLRLLPDQAQRGQLDAVALMLDLGWPVAVKGDWDASALNQAAFRGDAAMVRLLLQHGARWDEGNGYGGTALGSCLHAALNERLPDGDHAAVLALLLDDGAPAPRDADALPDPLQAVIAERS